MGKVWGIGPDVEDPMYKIGDIVIFNEPKPHGFTHEDVDYIPVHGEQVVAMYTGSMKNIELKSDKKEQK